jgi:hypothetical protein
MTATTAHAALVAWPATTMGKGPALSKRNAATRLGRKLSAIETAIRRTKAGRPVVQPFPLPDGYAIDPETDRDVMVPYWYERTIVAYGIAANILDKHGKPRRDLAAA